MASVLVLAAALSAAGAVPVPQPRPKTEAAKSVPALRHDTTPASANAGDGISDMSKAVPLKDFLKQPRPSTVEQYKALSGTVAREKPALDTARSQSEALAREAAALQKKLIDSAARVEYLESETIRIDGEVVRLSAEYDRLAAEFARDRVSVSKLLAVLQRLQHDVPPAMAVRPDDALSAARSAMLIGSSLPRVYHDAAALARRITTLRQTRDALTARRKEAVETARSLTAARGDLDRLLTIKRQEAEAAAARYGVIKTRLDSIASQAVSLQVLLQKVAQVRGSASQVPNVVLSGPPRGKGQGWLIPPVAGAYKSGGVDGVGGNTAPGITYSTMAGATVVAPADGKIVYAGVLPKAGRVLILEIGGGYDAVLAGLDRLDVRTNDAVLAGEPIGALPKFDHETRLYFELRQKNGRGMSPAPYIAAALRKAR